MEPLAVYPDAMTTEDQRLLFRAIRELDYLERRDRARELRAARAWRRLSTERSSALDRDRAAGTWAVGHLPVAVG
jgi:hypothetical protein